MTAGGLPAAGSAPRGGGGVVGAGGGGVVGVGVDVVGVERFAAVLARGEALRARLFDPDEADLPVRSLAARFAAKEALAKALGAPPGLRWRDARVHRGEHGAPWVEMRGTVAARADALGVGAVHLSLSHDAGIATAFVVAERAVGAPVPPSPPVPQTAPPAPTPPPTRPTGPAAPGAPGPRAPDPTHPDPTHPGPTHPGPTRPDPTHPDPTHPEPGPPS